MQTNPVFVKRWEWDKWMECPVPALQRDDTVLISGHVMQLTAPPECNQRGRWVLHLEEFKRPEDPNFGIDLTGYSATPYTYMVMDDLCVGLMTYEDGTVQIRDDLVAPGIVFSPRLPRNEMEQFCRLHAGKYQRWSLLYATQIEEGLYEFFDMFWQQ